MNLDAVLELYRHDLFWLFPVTTTLVSMGAFLLFAVPMTWIAYKRPAWAEPYRIQERVGDAKKIVWPSVRFWLGNNLLMFVLTVLAWPFVHDVGIHTGLLPPWYVIALQVVFFIYLDDFLYYWMHRTLHHKRIYRQVHAVHHRVFVPWAITAHYMHPIEFVMTGTLALLGPALLGSHVVVVWIWIAFRQWEAAEGHSGYSFPWNPSHLVPGYGGVEYHDFHHAKFHGNYSGFLAIWDRVFGAYSKGYLERLRQKSGGLKVQT